MCEGAGNQEGKNKHEIIPKIDAIDESISICFNHWKITPLENQNGYAKFFEKTFYNSLKKFIDKDLANGFTYVPDKVKDNSRRLNDECKKRNIQVSNSTELRNLATEIGFSEKDYEDAREYMSMKRGLESLDISIDEKILPSSDIQYLEKENGRQILKFINAVFRMKKQENWKRALVTSIFYDFLHIYFSISEDSLDKYSFINQDVYNFSNKPTNTEIAKIWKVDKSMLTTFSKAFLDLSLDSVSSFKDFDDELKLALKDYLTDIRQKGKHNKKGEM